MKLRYARLSLNVRIGWRWKEGSTGVSLKCGKRAIILNLNPSFGPEGTTRRDRDGDPQVRSGHIGWPLLISVNGGGLQVETYEYNSSRSPIHIGVNSTKSVYPYRATDPTLSHRDNENRRMITNAFIVAFRAKQQVSLTNRFHRFHRLKLCPHVSFPPVTEHVIVVSTE